MEDTPRPDPTVEALSRLQSLLLNVADVNGFLQQLSQLAAGVVEPPASCGINAHLDGRPLTVVSSDDRANKLDETQFDLGDGPCLQAMQTGEPVYVSDVATERRWAAYIASAREQGLQSSLSLPLNTHGKTVGALNLFAFHAPHAFDGEQQQRCSIFAAQAAGALQLATRHLEDNELLDQLEQALSSRTVIDQAMGILMAQGQCSADSAFETLRRSSANSNQRLRDVAAQIVQQVTGEAPTDGKPFRSRRTSTT